MKLNKSLKIIALTGVAAICGMSTSVYAQTMTSPAKQAILIEASTEIGLFKSKISYTALPRRF